MADKAGEPRKTVPARNDLKPTGLYKGSQAAHLRGEDPNFVYEWKTFEKDHPSNAATKLDRHEYGTDVGGFVMLDGWQVCQQATDPRVEQLAPREDQGKPVDTLHRRGKQVLCRMPKDEHAKYQLADSAYQAAMEKHIYEPEKSGDGQASMTAVVSRDPNADRTQMLRAAGHNIPGVA